MVPLFAPLLIALLSTAPASANFTCPPPGFSPFSCPPLPTPSQPQDVLHLRPGNIAAVMALGDSITAGFAMRDGPLEYRGTVYSTGGDDNAITIGNFLANYNPKLKGRAQGETIPLTKDGKGLNFAVSGARVRDLPGQIERMAAKIDTPEYSDIKDQWKLLTIFIGANDICECDSMTADQFRTELTAALTQARQTFPKTFVNIMTIFNISGVWDVRSDRLYCEAAVPILHECSCLENNSTKLQRMDDLGLAVNQVTREVAAQFAALNDTQFTVVVQPAVEDVALTKYPPSVVQDLLSDLDCFHPSLCTDQGFAVGIWNNMFAPPSQKQNNIDPLDPPKPYCPTANDYLQ
eukprot:m.117465 g.117465  ORF g.117465 m.117465 type:complete len:349 (-) comp15427_c4_seq1:231-1277(-)